MVRVRFLVWLIASTLLLISATALAQGRSLFPNNKVPPQSAALRNPTRRPLPPPRPDTVELPYHLYWGDSQNRLASLFAGVGARVLNKKAEGQAEIWSVDGLIAPNLQGSLFTFAQGSLVALEFDYGQPGWTPEQFNAMLDQFHKLLDAKCAKPAEPVDRPAAPSPDNSVKQTLTGFQWKRGDTLVQLFYFTAEDPAKSLAYRSISVHYHYQDLTPPDASPLPDSDRATADPNANPLFGGGAKAVPSASLEAGPAATATPVPSPEYGPPPPPTPKPKAGSRDAEPLPER